MYDIAIIGAGPAGLTAAIYACRAGRKTLVLEANSYGGQIINTPEIENYPAEAHISGADFAKRIYDQAREQGAEIEFEKVEAIEREDEHFKITTEDDSYTALTVIIATGTENRKLGLDGEDRLIGRGISFCATCDGALYKDKVVAVAGGGNTAVGDAIYLANIAKKVYVIHRRDSFRASPAEVEKMRKFDSVEEILSANITGLLGEDYLTGLKIEKDGKVEDLACDALFVAVGREPSTDFAKALDIKLADGYLVADEACKTNLPGIFVAGDVRKKELRQLVTATADGATAAEAASRYLESIANIENPKSLFNICFVLHELGPISQEYLERILKDNCSKEIEMLRQMNILEAGERLKLAVDSLDALPFDGDSVEAAAIVNKAREDRKQSFPGETKIA